MNEKLEKRARVIDLLASHRQRATYAAVGAVVGLPPMSVMWGLPKNPLNSWVVSARDHRPTGYTPAEIDARLETRAHVITSADELMAWLRQHGWT